MLKPLQLNNITFAHNIIQGPLAGISSSPFRLLVSRYGKPAFTCTEMISCKTIIHQYKLSMQRFLVKDPNEGPVSFQLAGNNPIELAQAVKIVTDNGADLIDLNCGCPVNKIRKRGSGSSLLQQPNKLFHLIHVMKQNTHLPVSIKIRVDGHSQEKFNMDIAKVVSDAGADFLVVHGRHWTEHYDIACNYDQIQFFVDQLKIPVIGNGDISDLHSLRKMFETGCAGVMIARAGVGQPWLIQKLIAEINQESFFIPSLQEIGLIFMEHIQRLAQLLCNEKIAILQARKYAKYYARELENKLGFVSAVNTCENLSTLQEISYRYFSQ